MNELDDIAPQWAIPWIHLTHAEPPFILPKNPIITIIKSYSETLRNENDVDLLLYSVIFRIRGLSTLFKFYGVDVLPTFEVIETALLKRFKQSQWP